MKAAALETDALPAEGRGLWLLAGFIVLSLFAHALALYVFQIIYPPPAPLTAPPPEVSVLDLSNPANDGARRWIEAQDPALISSSSETVPQSLLTFPYQPSYAGVHSAPKAVDAEPPSVVSPPAQDPAAVIRRAAEPAPAPEDAAAPESSGIRFSGPLAARGLASESAKAPGFSGESSPILDHARFLIAITDKGEVRYIFLQHSSGDKAMDDQAEARLSQMRFAPDAAPLAWGFASFYWGNDAYGGKR